MKNLITAFLLVFYSAANADIDLEKPPVLLCSEKANPNYEYVIFMIKDGGWLYDVINTREARLQTYGILSYKFQTYSPHFRENTYFSRAGSIAPIKIYASDNE